MVFALFVAIIWFASIAKTFRLPQGMRLPRSLTIPPLLSHRIDPQMLDEKDTFPLHDLHVNNSEPVELSRFYRRDKHDTASIAHLDLSLLQQLLENRHDARGINNITEMENIDHMLRRDYSIRVYDHPSIWTLRKEPPISHFRKQSLMRQQDLMERYGPTGHEFIQVGRKQYLLCSSSSNPMATIECCLPLVDIHRLLSLRTLYLEQGRREKANALTFELQIHGVRINDDYLQWTVDPDWKFEPTTRLLNDRKKLLIYTYQPQPQQLPCETIFDERTLQRIQHLLYRRAIALGQDDVDNARFISLELCQTYRITINDNTQTWSIANATENAVVTLEQVSALLKQKQAQINGNLAIPLLFANQLGQYDSTNYRMSELSRELPPGLICRIRELVLERIHKREEAKYVEADAIRKELWATYGVGINDRLNQFSVGGVFDDCYVTTTT